MAGQGEAAPQYKAFLCYARFDDAYLEKAITALREELAVSVQSLTGVPFPIFQDVAALTAGVNWRDGLSGALRSVTFLLPVVTPSFFTSTECQNELKAFVEVERARGRGDLILPLYLIDVPQLAAPKPGDYGGLAALIASRQLIDLRQLPSVGRATKKHKALVNMAAQKIRDAWTRLQEAELRAPPGPPQDEPHLPAQHPLVRCKAHRREWRVDANGTIHAKVLFDEVDAQGVFPLAVVTPPYCNIAYQQTAKADGAALQVTRKDLPDGRIWFVLEGRGQPSPRVEWEYWLSNAVALTRAELELLPRRQRWFPNLRGLEDYDLRSHVVRAPAGRLTLRLELAAEAGAIEDAFAMVEQPEDQYGRVLWYRLSREEPRCEVSREGDRAVSLTVEQPLLGCRYGIAYRPARQGARWSPALRETARALLAACESDGFGEALEEQLGEMFAIALPPEAQALGAACSWMAMLWEEGMRHLRPVCGRFPQTSWATRFEAGSGVAGHAFRSARTAAWSADVKGTGTLIYQPPPAERKARDYRWILNVPLWADSLEACVGVVGLACSEELTEADRRLGELAHAICEGKETAATSALRAALEVSLNVGFWNAAAEGAKNLTEEQRRLARAARQLLLPDDPDSPGG